MSQNLSAPFTFQPSHSWDGNDGNWSTFVVRVGTPPQGFKILPSTSGHQTWVPVPLGCTSSDPPDCGMLRGTLPSRGAPSNGFLANQSSSWIENGIYDLGIDSHINLTGNGDYGYDTVALGLENTTGLSLTHQVVAGIATKDFYLGQWGLDPRPSNFTTYDDPIPSYLKDLVDSNLIPSLSYGYTAGARYRLDGVFASLILGGYDSSRSIPSNFTIPFASDNTRTLSVGLQSITASDTFQGSVDLLPDGGLFMIDSSVPDLWLPMSSCSMFEQAFGLTFDNATNLYTVNNSIHNRLRQSNPSVVFKIGIQPVHGPTVDISLPYGAFDLQTSSPIYSNATNRFPLRRAANQTQYTLGRTLLQEAHLIVDYERSNFSVNRAIFRDPSPEVIVTIQPQDLTPSKLPLHHDHITRGAIAGIVLGAIAFLSAFIIIFSFLLRKHKRLKKTAATPSPAELENPAIQAANEDTGSSRLWVQELDPKAEVPRDPQELGIPSLSIPMRPRFELRGISAVSELAAPDAQNVMCPATSEISDPPACEVRSSSPDR